MADYDVLVDVDDTIAETQMLLLDKINPITGNKYTFDGMTRGHRENHPDFREWNENVWELLNQPEVMAEVEPTPGAIEAFELLLVADVAPHIVTARQSPLFATTDAWLNDHGFYFPGMKIHRRQKGERGSEFKVRIAKEVGFDAAFEDTYDVAIALAEHVGTVFLIAKPWNANEELPSNVRRVNSFSEGAFKFLDLIGFNDEPVV